jgi:recombination protein RecT
MSETVSQAVAQRQNTPGELIKQYSTSFAAVLPTHVKPETWVRLAQGALKKGKRIDINPDGTGPFELEVAATNNPGAFLAALLDAARQGLTPGTEEYYLTPRKVKGQLEILGITGYQGYVELMYRAGAVSSVVVQVVRENDFYRYNRGEDRTPVHRVQAVRPGRRTRRARRRLRLRRDGRRLVSPGGRAEPATTSTGSASQPGVGRSTRRGRTGNRPCG